MGAYLSEPKTSKESTDLDGVRVKYGASSMQGWRISQEDAHNCLLEFDKDSSLFAVYDGHGGHEVAEYCSKILPDFIKQTESYINGDYKQALIDAFLGFDATLATPHVISVLKGIARGREGDKRISDPEVESDFEEEEAIENLVQEAHMPLDEVMAKYKAVGPLGRVLKMEGKPLSPMLRGRRSLTSDAASSGNNKSGEGPSSSSLSNSSQSCLSKDAEVSSSSNYDAPALCNGDIHVNGEVEGNGRNIKTEREKVESSDVKKDNTIKLESDKCADLKMCMRKKVRTEPDSSGLSNGDSQSVSSSSENLSAGNEGSAGISSNNTAKKKRVSSRDIYRTLLEEDSDSEEEDETFTADPESFSDDGSSDELVEDTEDKEGNEEDDSSIDDDEEEDCDAEYPGMAVKEEPGSDSGCTAVVSLLVGSELFVANAGDSRCVICREGKALEMSIDHKPEDVQEKERIEAAGGSVTYDGRVNGGLNLSRAMGDHSYKQVKLLPPEKQMITALPDVQKITIDPSKDEFMVLACDGIWNSMTSQEVVDFVRIKQQQNIEKLSQICEELFDHCLAPDTLGDGTGCDNMTCIIVKFKPESQTYKRLAEECGMEPSAKKSKVEEKHQPI